MMNNDEDLKPLFGDAVEEDIDELKASELVREVLDIAIEFWAEVAADAVAHERTYHGFDVGVNREYDGPVHGRHSMNNFKQIVNATNSRLNQDNVEFRVFPTHPGAGDSVKAELASRFLQWWRRDQRFREREYEFGQNGQLHGAAFWKVYWDKNAGDPLLENKVNSDGEFVFDEDGEQLQEIIGYEGGVRADIFTVFDTCFGPGHRVEDANWCLFRKYVSKDEALAMLHDAGLDSSKLPKEHDYQLVTNGNAKGYPVFEVWYKPGPRFPNGVFIKTLDEVVLTVGAYPYDHGELPIAVWQPDYVRDRPFGTSPMFNVYQLQLELNHVESKKRELMNRMAGVMFLVPPGYKDEIEEGNLVIEVDQQANSLFRAVTFPVPPMIQERAVELVRAMYDVAGVNEVLAGAESIKAGTSARTYEFLNRTDSAKMAGSINRYRGAMWRRDRMALHLFQQFADTKRKISVIGEDKEVYVELLNGDMLSGLDITMEAVPGADNMRSTQANGAVESAQMGMIAPGDVAEVSQSGLNTTISGSSQATAIQQMLQQAAVMGDQAVQPDQSIDPTVALMEISRFRALGGQAANESVLKRFEDFYRAMLAQQQQPQQGVQ